MSSRGLSSYLYSVRTSRFIRPALFVQVADGVVRFGDVEYLAGALLALLLAVWVCVPSGPFYALGGGLVLVRGKLRSRQGPCICAVLGVVLLVILKKEKATFAIYSTETASK